MHKTGPYIVQYVLLDICICFIIHSCAFRYIYMDNICKSELPPYRMAIYGKYIYIDLAETNHSSCHQPNNSKRMVVDRFQNPIWGWMIYTPPKKKNVETKHINIPILYWNATALLRTITLRWRHNGHDRGSNHQPHDCLLNHLYRRRSKKTSKLRVTGLCAGNSPGTGEFHAQMASNAENVSIWWRHHEKVSTWLKS